MKALPLYLYGFLASGLAEVRGLAGVDVHARRTSPPDQWTSLAGGLPGSRLVWRGVASAWSGGGAPRLVWRGCTPPGLAGGAPCWLRLGGGRCTLLAAPGGARVAHVHTRVNVHPTRVFARFTCV
ncbi:hypothetical protein Taro_013583 [Colocasia esculenta]|uniref:Uncharacterized protein n=1 Tax=Colocasia esculenta TaxID=4460 RepID=A0A843UCG7_COLES|nr:hypothetical protein [Colocasia esculenta]